MPQEQARAQPADKPAGSGKKKQTLVMVGILLFVMMAEGGGVYFAVKFFGGGPKVVAAEGLSTLGRGGGPDGPGDLVQDVELPVVKFKAPNMKSGRLFLYDIEVYAKTKKDRGDTLKKLIDNYKATLEDRLNRVVRAAEPQDLQEDGLETIRRQVRHEVGQVVGDEKLIDEILIPKCTPFKVDY